MIRHSAAALCLAFATGGASATIASAESASDKMGASDKMNERMERMTKRFERLDKNKDGVVSRDEIEQPLIRAFTRADKNDDGVVDAAEIKALGERASKKRGGRGERLAKRFESADADRDGRVTREEFLPRTPKWLARADDDGDGRITKAELQLFAERGMQKRAAREN